jgi:hypothetical protein
MGATFSCWASTIDVSDTHQDEKIARTGWLLCVFSCRRSDVSRATDICGPQWLGICNTISGQHTKTMTSLTLCAGRRRDGERRSVIPFLRFAILCLCYDHQLLSQADWIPKRSLTIMVTLLVARLLPHDRLKVPLPDLSPCFCLVLYFIVLILTLWLCFRHHRPHSSTLALHRGVILNFSRRRSQPFALHRRAGLNGLSGLSGLTRFGLLDRDLGVGSLVPESHEDGVVSRDEPAGLKVHVQLHRLGQIAFKVCRDELEESDALQVDVVLNSKSDVIHCEIQLRRKMFSILAHGEAKETGNHAADHSPRPS